MFGGYDISGDSNKVTLKTSAEVLDKTTFGATAKGRICGLLDTTLDAEGFWNAPKDEGLFGAISATDTVIAVSPAVGVAGDLAYFARYQTADYTPLDAKVGDLVAFSLSANGSGLLVRGTVLERGAKTATASGTARLIGAVAAGQKIYAGLHVLAVSGTNPTLTMKLQSDDAVGMATPTDRITFDQMTAIGAQWKELTGPVADTYWRVNYTLGGTTPSFLVVVTVGIQ